MFELSLVTLALGASRWVAFEFGSYVHQLIPALLAAVYFSFRKPSAGAVASLSLVAAYRPGLFYYWDEWELITKFAVGVVPEYHNEHALPYFLPLLKALFETAGTNYYLLWCLLALLHCASSLLCLELLKKHFAEQYALYGALFYAVCAHHSESTSWVLLLGLSVVKLIALILMLKGSWKLSFCLSLLGPLFSSLGLLLPLQTAVYFLIYQREVLLKNVLSSAAGVGSALMLIGGISTSSSSAPSVFDLIKYLLVSTEVGATLRGLGLIPTLGLNYGLIADHLGLQEKSLFLALVLLGLFFSVVLFFAVSRKTFFFFKLSSVCWLGPVIAARTALKARGALAARYQEPVVASLSFVVCELFKRSGRLAPLLCFFLILVQSFMSLTFRLDERKQWSEFSGAPCVLNKVDLITPNASAAYVRHALSYLSGEALCGDVRSQDQAHQ